MALSVAGGDRNFATCLFIFIDPALQIAEGIAAEFEIILGDGAGGEGAAAAAAGGCFLAGWFWRWQRFCARGGFERRVKSGGCRFGNAGRIGKARIGFEGGAVNDGGRFRRMGNIGKRWIGLPGVIWPCRR